ncbi:MAG: DUF1553 domain-containing protein, partial [Akkermansiaceae bacterium]|nr:DUF1553 domain-containing protein [Akkermansiaceae bacterium]
TLTPLQPLVLMNSPQFVEASRALATRTLKEAPDDADRIRTLFLRMIGRMPVPGEIEALTHLLAE